MTLEQSTPATAEVHAVIIDRILSAKLAWEQSNTPTFTSWVAVAPVRQIIITTVQLVSLCEELRMKYTMTLASYQAILDQINDEPLFDGMPTVAISAYGILFQRK